MSRIATLLHADNNLEDRTTMSPVTICRLTELCYEPHILSFRRSSINRRMGLLWAHLFLLWLLISIWKDLKRKLWTLLLTDHHSGYAIYVNETFVIWPHGPDKLENFHSHLNSLRKSIQFTIEREQSNQLLFLDVLVTPHPSIGKQHTQISIYTMSPITIQESRVGS